MIGSGKGGTGKTTLASGLAPVLVAEHGRSVALVDADPQGSLTTFLGQPLSGDPLTADPVQVHGVDLYRGGRAMATASGDELSALVDRALAGDGAPHVGEGDDRDRVVIVDLRGTLDDNGHTGRLLERPDVVLLVVPAAEMRSVPEARKLTSAAEGQGVPFVVAINKRQRRAASALAAETMRTFWSTSMAVEVPDLADVGVAESRMQPVTIAVPRSPVAERIRALASALVERGLI